MNKKILVIILLALLVLSTLASIVSAQINLTAIDLDTNIVCEGGSINFRPIDSNSITVFPDYVYVYLNNTLYEDKISYNVSSDTYFVPLNNTKTGELDVFFIAIQQGKMVNLSKTFMVEDCNTITQTMYNNLISFSKDLEDFYKENKALSVMILGIIFFLIIIAILIRMDMR